MEHRIKGELIAASAAGLNKHRRKQHCAIIFSGKATKADRGMMKVFGLTDDHIERAREDELIRQFAMRGAIRDPTFDDAYDKDFDQIMAWSVDRLGRSLPDLVAFLNDIQSKNVDLYLHQQGLDTSTPSGRMMFQMLGVFAEFERAMIRERILAGLRRTTKKSGRKPMPDDRVEAIRKSLADGQGIRATARLHRASPMTVTAIKRSMESVPA
jgi:hypothetical protein